MSDAQLVMEVSCAECLQTIRHDFFGWVARGCGNCAQGVPGWGVIFDESGRQRWQPSGLPVVEVVEQRIIKSEADGREGLSVGAEEFFEQRGVKMQLRGELSAMVGEELLERGAGWVGLAAGDFVIRGGFVINDPPAWCRDAERGWGFRKEAAVRTKGGPARATIGGAKLSGPGGFSEGVRVRRENPLAERVSGGALDGGDGAVGELAGLSRGKAERAEMSGEDGRTVGEQGLGGFGELSRASEVLEQKVDGDAFGAGVESTGSARVERRRVGI